MTLLEVQSLTKRYGSVTAVDDLSFTLAAGETLALLGPNGAGKTTTMGCIVGLVQPESGQILVDGMSPLSREANAMVGYAAQRTALYPPLNVAENLDFYGGLYGLRGAALADSVAKTVELLDLSSLLSRRAMDLSVGQAKLVHVATTVLHDPQLLIVDEPTAGLDVGARGRVTDGLRKLASEGMAIIFSTHYLEEAEDTCDLLLLIDKGERVASGSMEELLATHAEPTTIIRLSTGETLSFTGGDLNKAINSVDPNLITELVVERPSLRRLYERMVGGPDD